jgi:uncharacterized repeat protein (TIGR02543 family)
MMVEITAIPAVGYRFAGWTLSGWDGTTTEITDTITIKITRNENVVASFEPILYHLVTNISPDASGQVTLEPAQPAEGYIAGTKVTLRATPQNGYFFNGWHGDSSGTKRIMVVTMDSDKSIQAIFLPKPPFSLWPWIGGVLGIIIIGFLVFVFVRKR